MRGMGPEFAYLKIMRKFEKAQILGGKDFPSTKVSRAKAEEATALQSTVSESGP